MRKIYTFSLAFVGIAACFAVIALTNPTVASTSLFLNEQPDLEFVRFVQKFGKSYGTKEEYEFRKTLFTSNLNKIMEHNSQNGASFHLAANHFSDWTPEEYKRLLGYKPSMGRLRESRVQIFATEGLPEEVNWFTDNNPMKKRMVMPPKDQKQCGSCWAFSAVAAMEGAHAIKSGDLVSMSEQQVVDCANAKVDPEFQSNGCEGGEMDDGFLYAEKQKMDKEEEYPYVGRDQACKPKSGFFNTISYVDVTPNNEDQLLAAIAKGPVSVAIEADQQVFQFYSGGVFDSPKCGIQLDHGVTVVGYGIEGGKPYYLVKNSWGPQWGDHGFIKIARGTSDKTAGICGIQAQPSIPSARN